MNDEHSDIFSTAADRSNNPLQLFWPGSKSVCEPYIFSEIKEWRDFIANLSLNRQVPEIVARKFERAQQLYFLSWFGIDIIKAGELAALLALELSLKNAYPEVYNRIDKNGKPVNAYIRDGLKHMVDKDNLRDNVLPIYQKCGGAIISNFLNEKGDQTGSLVGIRNSLAHGDPFDGLPLSGLLEVVRDLIDYMYRNNPESHDRSV